MIFDQNKNVFPILLYNLWSITTNHLILHYILVHNTALHYIAQHQCTTQHRTALHYTTPMHYTTHHNATLHNTTRQTITLNTTLQHSTLQHNSLNTLQHTATKSTIMQNNTSEHNTPKLKHYSTTKRNTPPQPSTLEHNIELHVMWCDVMVRCDVNVMRLILHFSRYSRFLGWVRNNRGYTSNRSLPENKVSRLRYYIYKRCFFAQFSK